MRIRAFTRITFAACLSGVALPGLSSASCTQPEMLCNVSSAPYIVQYLPKDPGSDCLMLPGEIIGMKTYNPPLPGGENVDASRTNIAIQAVSVGDLADEAQSIDATDPDPTHKQYSFGDYTNRPDANSFCVASGLSPAEQHIPETAYTDADGNAQVFPETRLRYQWSALRAYTTFAIPGTVATGEVTITKEVTDPMTGMPDSCTVTYIANALYPVVDCEVMDDMGNPTGSPDDARCCAKADLLSGKTFGSGIHPDFKVKCDPMLLKCVLDWQPGEAFPPIGANPACDGGQ